jgi:soluble lytic murein transglycosylase-like protein
VRLEVRADGTKVMVGSGSSSSSAGAARPLPQTPRARPAPPHLETWIREAAGRLALDPDLIRAVIQVESDFDPRATSHKGAMGLMQLMPQTAATLAVSDPYDPRQNISGGAVYLGRMLRRFGRTDLALAAYNAGPEAVVRYGGIPPYVETRDYVEKVLRIHRHDPDFRLQPGAISGATAGRPRTYLYRDPNGSLVMTTEPPG